MPTTTDVQERLDAAPQPPACPDWCGLPPGHPYEPSCWYGPDSGIADRTHVHRFGQHIVVQAVEDRAPDGTVTLDAGTVSIATDFENTLSAAEAYQIAGQLREAALLAQRIEREASK